MRKGSFFTPAEDYRDFIRVATMIDQEGIYVTWTTDPQTLAKIIPPQLTPVAPVVFAYFINIQKATFCARYTEAAIGVPCVAPNGVQGIYWLQFLLSGPGAEMGTYLGREVIGIPKKIADEISVNRIGNYASAKVVRHGVTIAEIEMDITGEYPNAAAASVLGDPKPGDKALLPGLFYRYDYEKLRDGSTHFYDGKLCNFAFNIDWHGYEKGSCEVKLYDSIEDPWSELKVVEVLGAGYIKNDIDLTWAEVIQNVDVDEVMPYLLAARYDKGVMNKGEQRFY